MQLAILGPEQIAFTENRHEIKRKNIAFIVYGKARLDILTIDVLKETHEDETISKDISKNHSYPH
jgi:hypothetical protein